MKTPQHTARVDLATCPSCKRQITATVIVQVKVEQPKGPVGEAKRCISPSTARPANITVTATPTIVGLDVDHNCGEAIRAEEAR